MLKTVDFSQSLSKASYKEFMDPLREEWRDLQRWVIESKRPVLILLEGLQAAGKGDSIRQIVLPLDPRGFKVHLTTIHPTEEEKLYPSLWRHWLPIAEQGEIGIYDTAWYMPLVDERINQRLSEGEWSHRKDEIKQFERQLVDDGSILIKFFLHLSKKEQKKRFKRMEKSAYEGWRVTKEDWKNHKRYEHFIETLDEILVETDMPYAPWNIIAADKKRYRRVHIMRAITETIKRCLEEPPQFNTTITAMPTKTELQHPEAHSILDRVDLSLSLSREEYKNQLDGYQERLRKLEFACYQKRKPVVIVYEGWDASGKGGNIKRVTQKMDARGYNVIPMAAPQGEEATHHYLWRFWKHIPKGGHFTIFDRSWYGRVLVERIEGFCKEEEWKRAYHEINEFERHLAHFGTVIVKFWIHLSQEEQWRRFEERKNTPHKQHKLTEEDYRNREKWDLYARAVNEMIARTSTHYAPWTIIEGDCKLWARIRALRTIIQAIEEQLGLN